MAWDIERRLIKSFCWPDGEVVLLSSYRIVLCAFLLLSAGCSETSSPRPASEGRRPGVSDLARNEIKEALSGRGQREVEDDILRMEAAIPGFGGAYREKGDIVVFVPAATARSSVLEALSRVAPSLNLEPRSKLQLSNGSGIRLRTATFPFSSLIVWERMLAPRLHRAGVLTFIDADEAKNQVTLGITRLEQDEHRPIGGS